MKRLKVLIDKEISKMNLSDDIDINELKRRVLQRLEKKLYKQLKQGLEDLKQQELQKLGQQQKQHIHLVVYDDNDLNVDRIKLAQKRFHVLGDPNNMFSPQELWNHFGLVQTNVYILVPHHIGHIMYDYTTHSATFVRTKQTPVPEVKTTESTEQNIERYIKLNVDLDRKIHDAVEKVVKDRIDAMLKGSATTIQEQTQNNITEPQTVKDIMLTANPVKTTPEIIQKIKEKNKDLQILEEQEDFIKLKIGQKEYYYIRDGIDRTVLYEKQ